MRVELFSMGFSESINNSLLSLFISSIGRLERADDEQKKKEREKKERRIAFETPSFGEEGLSGPTGWLRKMYGAAGQFDKLLDSVEREPQFINSSGEQMIISKDYMVRFMNDIREQFNAMADSGFLLANHFKNLADENTQQALDEVELRHVVKKPRKTVSRKIDYCNCQNSCKSGYCHCVKNFKECNVKCKCKNNSACKNKYKAAIEPIHDDDDDYFPNID